MKIALVHDYLVQYGGAERVLESFAEIFPQAHIYTIVSDKKIIKRSFSSKIIHTSFLQKNLLARRWHRLFPLLMPLAIEQFDFSQYDIVLSDSSSYAKGIITHPHTLHISYVHTPMRYAWDDCQKYTQDFGFPRWIKNMIPFAMNYLRIWDRISFSRVDKVIANSNFVAKRIKKYYHRSAQVIHPPVNIENFYVNSQQKSYYLMVGRLIAYKRHDIAIKAFNQLGLPLKIIGRGPELKRLKKIANSNIEFLERVSDKELPHYYAQCQAFIFPQEEDFGIVAIEAMASGRPLIAFKGGDIVEHLENNKTGIFFEKQTPESIIKAVKKSQKINFNSAYIHSQALKFDKKIFQRKIKKYIEKEFEKHIDKKNKGVLN